MTTVVIHGGFTTRRGIRDIIRAEAVARPISWSEKWHWLSSSFLITGAAQDLLDIDARIEYYLRVKA